MYNTSLSFDSIAIIESLPAGDLRTGQDLFESVAVPVSTNDPGFVSKLYQLTTRQQFFSALSEIAEITRQYGRAPIVHIETHGGPKGITLAEGETVLWMEIAPRLTQINESCKVNLLVVAAMCHGWYMGDILRPTDRTPAFGIIGTEDTVPAGVLLTSMQAFYGRLLTAPHDLRDALEAANETQQVRDWRFTVVGAEIMFCRAFAHYVESLSVEESQTDRVSRLVADVARNNRLDVRQTMDLRDSLTRELNDHAGWFAYYRRKFLMLDMFPDNEPRFPLTYEKCIELTAHAVG